jgi:hypothetical protein
MDVLCAEGESCGDELLERFFGVCGEGCLGELVSEASGDG